VSKASPEIFISYSADAKSWARKLSDSLESKGLSTWTDFKNIKPGQRVIDEMHRALDEARYFVIVVGPKIQPAEWQDREWQGALRQTWTHQEKRIIPVLLKKTTAPPFLRNWGAVRIQPEKPDSLWIDAIYDAVNGTLSERSTLGKQVAKPNKALHARLREMETVAKQMKSLQEH
jgi:hypothetical protein